MDSDERPENLPAVPEEAGVVHTTPLEIPVAEFEGEMVRRMLGKIPAISLEMDYGYARGTHLKLELEVRVKSVRVDEATTGAHKGELFREHAFVIEEAKIIGAYTAEQLDPGVGGSASAAATFEERQAEEQELESDARPEEKGEGHERFDPGF